MEIPRKFITANLSICKLGSSSVLIICPQTKKYYMFYRHANLQRTYESKIILEEISRKMFPFLKQSIKKFALKWFGNLGLS